MLFAARRDRAVLNGRSLLWSPVGYTGTNGRVRTCDRSLGLLTDEDENTENQREKRNAQ